MHENMKIIKAVKDGVVQLVRPVINILLTTKEVVTSSLSSPSFVNDHQDFEPSNSKFNDKLRNLLHDLSLLLRESFLFLLEVSNVMELSRTYCRGKVFSEEQTNTSDSSIIYSLNEEEFSTIITLCNLCNISIDDRKAVVGPRNNIDIMMENSKWNIIKYQNALLARYHKVADSTSKIRSTKQITDVDFLHALRHSQETINGIVLSQEQIEGIIPFQLANPNYFFIHLFLPSLGNRSKSTNYSNENGSTLRKLEIRSPLSLEIQSVSNARQNSNCLPILVWGMDIIGRLHVLYELVNGFDFDAHMKDENTTLRKNHYLSDMVSIASILIKVVKGVEIEEEQEGNTDGGIVSFKSQSQCDSKSDELQNRQIHLFYAQIRPLLIFVYDLTKTSTEHELALAQRLGGLLKEISSLKFLSQFEMEVEVSSTNKLPPSFKFNSEFIEYFDRLF